MTGGVAVIRIRRRRREPKLWRSRPDDKEGNRASSTVPLQARDGADQILLRTERALSIEPETASH